MTTPFQQALRNYRVELAAANRERLLSIPEGFSEMSAEARGRILSAADRRFEARRRAAFRAVREAREAREAGWTL